MDPDTEYNAKIKAHEDGKLAKAVASLSREAKESTYREGLELQANQNSEQDLSCLPSVRITDVAPQGHVYHVRQRTQPSSSTTQFYGAQPTNGLTHFHGRISFDLPEPLRIYLPLYTKALTWMGTANRDRLAYANQMEAYTGGISFAPQVSFNPRGWLILSVHSPSLALFL